MDQIEIGTLDAAELPEAVAALARGLRDNPLPVALFGRDPGQRAHHLACLMGELGEVLGWQRHLLIARHADGEIVGVCGVLPPGERDPDIAQRLGLLRAVLRSVPGETARVRRWPDPSVMPDPRNRHWRLGPLAVDPARRGMGVGGALLRVACARIDAAGDDASLETDQLATVGFFAHFGFAVTGERHRAGVPIWRMLRHAEPGHLVGPIPRPPPAPR